MFASPLSELYIILHSQKTAVDIAKGIIYGTQTIKIFCKGGRDAELL